MLATNALGFDHGSSALDRDRERVTRTRLARLARIPACRGVLREDAFLEQPQPIVEALETSMVHREPEPQPGRAKNATVGFVVAVLLVVAIVLAYLLLS
jgi:hypothetical protein